MAIIAGSLIVVRVVPAAVFIGIVPAILKIYCVDA